jgi:imidazolonepropionase-like amidohydrolase
MNPSLMQTPAQHGITSNSWWSVRFVLIVAAFSWSSPALSSGWAIRGDLIHSMAGEPIRNGVILIRDGCIESVGPASAVAVPDGYETLHARVITPGLIDAHSVVGLAGILNQPHDQEQVDRSAPIQPELRAIDGYNALDPLIEWLRSFGITTVHTGHAPAALVPGQTMIIKTHPPDTRHALMVERAMVVATLGPSATGPGDKGPGTSGKAVALLRSELIKASEYHRKRKTADAEKQPARDLRLEAMVEVLEGTKPMLLTAHRHQDILAALRLADEFNLHLVLDGVADAPLVIDQIRRSGFPVILHPSMIRTMGQAENASFETAVALRQAGIPFALQSGYEGYVPRIRVVLLEAAIAAAHGLSFAEALASITIDAARILNIQDRVGSIEPGKDADLALYDGDPFEYTTRCVGVMVSGVLTDQTPR